MRYTNPRTLLLLFYFQLGVLQLGSLQILTVQIFDCPDFVGTPLNFPLPYCLIVRSRVVRWNRVAESFSGCLLCCVKLVLCYYCLLSDDDDDVLCACSCGGRAKPVMRDYTKETFCWASTASSVEQWVTHRRWRCSRMQSTASVSLSFG